MLPPLEVAGERQRRDTEGRADTAEELASVAQQSGPDAPHPRHSMPGPWPELMRFVPCELDARRGRR
jgi:hypothetical protein